MREADLKPPAVLIGPVDEMRERRRAGGRHRGTAVEADVPPRTERRGGSKEAGKAMLSKIEKLGDRLLGLVVPHAQASAQSCVCIYVNDCDVSRLRWQCCTTPVGGSNYCWYECNYRNPC
ncbi:hypothetical protein E1281_05940 [Actinomadura sp. KC345]|uniref:hypothetical protein n=1 Tax=Actinomadura sp. KC345 TaxID=2530371 RepID=UPI0010523844|nr:hypothetical protein [Actinomadura sp. KC345]TDC57176.1 hypothetical protein E1281_05940 [Actinomadura sp. KC345]